MSKITIVKSNVSTSINQLETLKSSITKIQGEIGQVSLPFSCANLGQASSSLNQAKANISNYIASTNQSLDFGINVDRDTKSAVDAIESWQA